MSTSLEGMTPEQISGLASLAKTLGDSPETRSDFLKLVKKANPNTPIPEVDMQVHIDAATAPMREQLQKLENEKRERDARDNIREMQERVIASGKIKREDLPEVEKLMLEKNILSYDTAAEFYTSQKQVAVPTPGSYAGVQTLPKPDLKPFGGNIKQWGRQTAASVIDDIRAGRIVAGT